MSYSQKIEDLIAQRDALQEQLNLALGTIESRDRNIETVVATNRELGLQLAALEGQEPVGKVSDVDTEDGMPYAVVDLQKMVTSGDKLYATAGVAPSIANAIHYPECWDTAAYPTVESALHEMTAEFQCANDHCAHLATTRVAPMTQDRAEALAHRRCKRYRMGADVPYQFDAHTLMDFVWDVEKAGAAPVPPAANIHTAPKCLNTNDKAMYITGWNECRDSMLAAAPRSAS